MTDKRFEPDMERYLVDYMNEHYPSSVYWYARTYGDLWDAENAVMLALDREGMELSVEMSDGSEQQIRIAFDHVLKDDDDAQSTLVEMSMKAREMIMQRAEQQRQNAG